MYNSQISELLNEIADMLSLDEKDRKFEVLAYRKAALTIGGLQEDVADIYHKGGVEALMELPGVGKGIAGSIKEYIETGRMEKFNDLKKKYPVDFKSLTKIQGMGAKKAFKLYKLLKVKNIDDLKRVIAQHRIRVSRDSARRARRTSARESSSWNRARAGWRSARLFRKPRPW